MIGLLTRGFSTVVTLQNAPSIELKGREVTPVGLSAGGPIETTSMRNTDWRTSAPKRLKELTPMSVIMAVGTDQIPLVKEQVGINQEIRISFPDGFRMGFYGWVDAFSLGAISEGEKTLATLILQPSMVNLLGEETPPIYYGVWILADGVWNDAGIWIDTETWND